MAKIVINLIAFPQTIKMFDGQTMKWSKEVPDANQTIREIVNQVEEPFDAIRLLKIIDMFKPEKITFEEL